MKKLKNNKRGMVSLEWVVLGVVALVFAVYVFYTWFPQQVRSIVNTSINDFGAMIGDSVNIPGFSTGGNNTYPVQPDDWTSTDMFQYTVTSNKVTITGLKSNADINGVLIVPKVIDGKDVITIGPNAFISKGLNKVLLPEGITSIGARAFQGNELTSITIPESVIAIGEHAFFSNKLTKVTLPSQLKVISSYCFAQNKFVRLTIPNSIETIGSGAFANNQLSTIDIPDTVFTIGTDAFKQNLLTNIIVGSATNSIGDGAFTEQQVSRGQVKVLGVSETEKSRFDRRWSSIFRVQDGHGNEYSRLQ